MSAKTFVDTNILLYAYDREDPIKHRIAKEIIEELWRQASGAVSMQVLQEFYVNVTRKIAVPLPKSEARMIVEDYFTWCVATGTAEVAMAFSIEDSAKIGFWDALIVAAAKRCGVTRILSEDLNPGQTIAGILIENPFAA